MKHKAKLSISKPNYSDGREKISIKVEDADAHVEFLSIEIDLDKFTDALTGSGNMPCDFDVRGLDCIGKVLKQIDLEFPLPKGVNQYDKGIKELTIKTAKKYTPEGWEASEYYSSQTSYFNKELDDAHLWARTNLYRWIDKDGT